MSEPVKPATEEDLHAYVDGQLGAERQAEVESWLAQDPDAAARVNAYRSQNAALRALFDPVTQEPVPNRLKDALAPKRSSWGMRAAAALAWVAVGGLGGYLVRDQLVPPPPSLAFAERAAVAHVVYAAEVRHPVEVTSDQTEHLVKWLSNRLGKPLRTPDFAPFGFELVGGRLLPGESGPAAQFMYQDAQKTRLTLYVSLPKAGTQAAAFRYREAGPVKVLYWIDRDLSFALVGELDAGRLTEIAHLAYEAFAS